MRYREVGPLADDGGSQLQRPGAEPSHLVESVLAEMTTDDLAWHFEKIDELAHLERIAAGEEHGVAALLQRVNDGCEERNMGRIVEINPDRPFVRARRCDGGVRHGDSQHAPLPDRTARGVARRILKSVQNE